MFKKENRLVPGVRFNNSFFVALPQFTLKEKKNGLAVNRFGVVVSKKVDKGAVGRNEVKRFIRTILMGLGSSMGSGHDILVIVKKEILSRTREENFLAIQSALEKAGVIRGEKQ